MDIAEKVCFLTRSFPRDEAFGMSSQMRRAAASIPANIAEGFGRVLRRAFIQFLRVAQGSLKELETHAMLSRRVGLPGEPEVTEHLSNCERLGKRLVRLVRSLDRCDP